MLVTECEHNKIESGGFVVCTLCGECFKDKVFNESQDSILQKSSISHNYKVSSITPSKVSPKQYKNIWRLKRAEKVIANDKTEGAIRRITVFLNNIKTHLDVSKLLYSQIMYQFKTLYPKLAEKRIKTYYLLGYLIFTLSKNTPHPISLRTITETFNTFGHRFSRRTIAQISLSCGLKLNKRVDIRKIFPQILGNIGVSESESQPIINKAIEIYRNTVSMVKSKNPYIYASAVIYYILRGYVSQKTIAKANNVAEFSLRDHYKQIKAIYGEK